MVIAVIGAGGRSGREFVDGALHAGHTVRAGVRGQEQLPEHERLTLVRGDATDKAHVAELLRGTDAVVSLVGHVKNSPSFVQTEIMSLVLSVMHEQGIKRLISLTGTGVRGAEDTPSLIDRVLNVAIKLIDPERIHDGIAHAAVLRESSTNWTVMRVLKLSDGPVQAFHLTEGGPAKLLVTRKTVVRAILAELEDKAWYRKMPVIS